MSETVSWWPAQADEVAALHGEISCLERAGVPLVEGLGEVAQDQPERLSQIALWVADQLAQGMSLSLTMTMLAGSSTSPLGDGAGDGSEAD